MKPRVIFFDIGHTLVTGAHQSPRRLLGSRLDLTEKETHRLGKLIMTHPAEDPSTLATAVAAQLPQRDPHRIEQEITRLWEDQTLCVRGIPGAHRLFRRLKGAGIRLGVISNIWHPFFNGFKKNFPEISSQLDFTVLSYRLQHKKPSLDIYREAARKAGEPPQNCWMVGDSYELDMEPARRLGFKTLWILCRPERERSLLVELLNAEKPLPDGVVEDLEAADRFFMERLGS